MLVDSVFSINPISEPLSYMNSSPIFKRYRLDKDGYFLVERPKNPSVVGSSIPGYHYDKIGYYEKEIIRDILISEKKFSVFRGATGSGKSSLFREITTFINDCCKASMSMAAIGSQADELISPPNCLAMSIDCHFDEFEREVNAKKLSSSAKARFEKEVNISILNAIFEVFIDSKSVNHFFKWLKRHGSDHNISTPLFSMVSSLDFSTSADVFEVKNLLYSYIISRSTQITTMLEILSFCRTYFSHFESIPRNWDFILIFDNADILMGECNVLLYSKLRGFSNSIHNKGLRIVMPCRLSTSAELRSKVGADFDSIIIHRSPDVINVLLFRMLYYIYLEQPDRKQWDESSACRFFELLLTLINDEHKIQNLIRSIVGTNSRLTLKYAKKCYESKRLIPRFDNLEQIEKFDGIFTKMIVRRHMLNLVNAILEDIALAARHQRKDRKSGEDWIITFFNIVNEIVKKECVHDDGKDTGVSIGFHSHVIRQITDRYDIDLNGILSKNNEILGALSVQLFHHRYDFFRLFVSLFKKEPNGNYRKLAKQIFLRIIDDVTELGINIDDAFTRSVFLECVNAVKSCSEKYIQMGSVEVDNSLIFDTKKLKTEVELIQRSHNENFLKSAADEVTSELGKAKFTGFDLYKAILVDEAWNADFDYSVTNPYTMNGIQFDPLRLWICYRLYEKTDLISVDDARNKLSFAALVACTKGRGRSIDDILDALAILTKPDGRLIYSLVDDHERVMRRELKDIDSIFLSWSGKNGIDELFHMPEFQSIMLLGLPEVRDALDISDSFDIFAEGRAADRIILLMRAQRWCINKEKIVLENYRLPKFNSSYPFFDQVVRGIPNLCAVVSSITGDRKSRHRELLDNVEIYLENIENTISELDISNLEILSQWNRNIFKGRANVDI